MTQEQKYTAITTAYTTKKVEDARESIQVIADGVLPEVKDALLDVQRGLEVGFDLSYEIVSRACDEIANKSVDDLERAYFEGEYCSVYTNDRLNLLTNQNEGEISFLMGEYQMDSIANACAVWYDQKVNEAIEALKNYILN